MSAEIVSVGEELLIGKTLNTNAHWLAQRLTQLGAVIERMTVVGDDLRKISQEISSARERGADLIITCGGLGPTFDDCTMAGLALALRRPLCLNRSALAQIVRKYRRRLGKDFQLTEARMKMARLPAGAKPIPNPLGTAPGAIVKKSRMTIAALPGVPAEMMAMFDASVAPLVKRIAGRTSFEDLRVKVSGIYESALSPIIDQVMSAHPGVYVKSHAGLSPPEKVPLIEVHIYARSPSRALARRRVMGATEAMIGHLNGARPKPSSSHSCAHLRGARSSSL